MPDRSPNAFSSRARTRAPTLTGLLVTVAALAGMPAACDLGSRSGAAGGGDALQHEYDSAGVRIVESSGPVWTEGAGWVVEEEPTLEFGVLEGDEAYQFDRIQAVFVVPGAGAPDEFGASGRIVVLDGGSRELRFFGPDGGFLHAVGGPGDGPGEFALMLGFSTNMAGPYAGDSIWVHDMFAGRLQIFDGEGAFGRLFVAPPIRSNWIRGPSPDGRFVLNTNTGDTPLALEHGWSYEYFMVLDAARGTVDTLGFVPLMERADRALGSPSLQFAAWGLLAAGPGGIYVAVTDGYEVRVYDPTRATGDAAAGGTGPVSSQTTTDEGSPSAERAAPPFHGLPPDALVRIFRRAWEPAPTTGAAWEAYLESEVPRRVADDPDPSAESRMRTILEGLPRKEHFPAFSRLLLDRVGSVWVQHYGPPGAILTRWDVFDPQGRWLGEVEMPEGLQVRDIGGDWVVGIHEDALGVQKVRVHALRKR